MKQINIAIFKILVETISDESDQTPGMKKHTGIEVGTGAQQPAVVHFGLRCVHCSGLRGLHDKIASSVLPWSDPKIIIWGQRGLTKVTVCEFVGIQLGFRNDNHAKVKDAV